MGEDRLQLRALSLTQPWASLVALGVKRLETRSWQTAHRGPLAIHASWGFPPSARRLCEEEPFLRLLEGVGLDEDTLPRRAVLGVCRLLGCHLITELEAQRIAHLGAGEALHMGGAAVVGVEAALGVRRFGAAVVTRVEAALGDFGAGRYAWELSEPRLCRRPSPAPGRLGVWRWETPVNFRDLEPEIAALLQEGR